MKSHLPNPNSRRRFLHRLGAIGLGPVLNWTPAHGTERKESGNAVCETIPAETAGPYPANGRRRQNALSLPGIVRSDIRSSVASAQGVANGATLTLNLQLTKVSEGCRPFAGAAVYLWHCTADGHYSMYTLPEENFLRGVQTSDQHGGLTFKTIVPGCYPGRWPHFHFSVYSDLDACTNGTRPIKTSQIALPEDFCRQVYKRPEYAGSSRNLDRLTLTRDGIFRDGVEQQMLSMSGTHNEGYSATISIAV